MDSKNLCNMKKSISVLKIISIVTILLNCISTVRAQVVANTNDSGAGSLRDEISQASSGDTITFAPNLEGATIMTSSTITISSDIVIIGFPDGDAVTVDANNSCRIFSVLNTGSATFYGVDFVRGFVSTGGAFLNSGMLELNYCRLYNNTADIQSLNQGGGAIFNNTNATLTLNHCELFNNGAMPAGPIGDGFAGAVYNRGAEMNVNYCSFYDNMVSTGQQSAYGGAIYSTATLNIRSSTFSGNECIGGNGGAIFSGSGSTLNISNSTLSDNESQGSGDNIWNAGSLSLYNTIVANAVANIHTDNIGTAVSLGNNILENSSGSNITLLTSDLTVDPMLDTLAYNGHSFTKTRALKCSSPAIDAGNSVNAPVEDQAGKVRVVGSSIDIGAYELQDPPTIVQNGLTLSIPEQGYFQWYNGPTAISGATDSSYTVTSNGSYHVDFLDVSGCPLSSNMVSIITVGITESDNQVAMKLKPNPASRIVTVSATDLAEIQLMDVSGRIIQQIAVVGSKETNIDISHLPAGIYLVSAKSTNGNVRVERLMKR
ncbi:MAG: T9SS type A sorting domain-containing protein [Flavobacteriales bacterium]|nr:T9SS type A sorting domain-containing protein [Flavobacteriales bacterium]